MDLYSELEIDSFSQTCRCCGRTFAQLTAFSNHLGSCALKKRKLANALLVAQGAYRERKRQRLSNNEKQATGMEASDPLFQHLSGSMLPGASVCDFLAVLLEITVA